MPSARAWGLAALLLAATPTLSHAQSSASLLNPGPSDGVVYGFLMTDGSVLYQGGNLADWWKFAPDQYGSYLNGTWTQVASLPASYQPYATTGQVLPDGRLLLVGGEYLVVGNKLVFTLTNESAIYDPLSNAWTMVKPPAGWGFIGDSPSTVLADGRFMLGQKISKRAVTFDPKTLTWAETATTGKHDFNAEEGWTLMPDGTVLTLDVKGHTNTERFMPNPDPTQTGWMTAGRTPDNITATDSDSSPLDYGNGRVYDPPGETGPAILRPDGTVFATGAVGPNEKVGHTAIYHPGPSKMLAGTWTKGPDFPPHIGAGDSYAVLLPNGHVLVETNPAGGAPDDGPDKLGKIRAHAARIVATTPANAPALATPATKPIPVYDLFDFDGTSLTLTQVEITGGQLSLLVLPTGEIGVGGVGLYVPTGSYAPDWAPRVTESPASVAAGGTYVITGEQFNGMSQANAYGDEFPVATNFPLVRITNDATGRVVYARTHDHSSMGVATGHRKVSTHFDVPDGIEPGASQLEVVANGIPSIPVAVTVK